MSHNHPSYVNAPYFVLQDKRLDFFNKFLFSFLWSFFVSGKRICASNRYLAELFCVSEKHVKERLKELEDLGLILRYTDNYKRFIKVLYMPSNDIEIDTDDTNNEPNNPKTGCNNTNVSNIELGAPTGAGGGTHRCPIY